MLYSQKKNTKKLFGTLHAFFFNFVTSLLSLLRLNPN